MRRFSLLLLAVPLLGQDRALDLMFLLERTPGIEQSSRSLNLNSLGPEDRGAVMTFSTKTRLIQTFTNDHAKLEAALHRPYVRLPVPRWHPGPPKPAEAHVRQGLLDATRVFRDLPADPNRRRAIVVIFGTDDNSTTPTFDEVKRVLAAAQIRLYAIAVRRLDYSHSRDSRVETPPTIPGRTPPVPTDRAPIPEATLKTLMQLAEAVGGQALSGEANVTGLVGRVRSDVQQPQKFRLVSGERTLRSSVAEVPSH